MSENMHQIVFNMLLTSLARTNTSSFVTSVQLTFSILRHIDISNASNSFLLALVNVQVSAAYKLQITYNINLETK